MRKIFTIGYEGIDIDSFISTLKRNNISILVDIRAVALSRKKGFSKTALRERLTREKIGYKHLSALGDPKSGREAARSGKINEFKLIYRYHLKGEDARQAMRELAEFSAIDNSCLLCFERDPAVCHRSIVAERLSRFGFEACDLFCHNTSANERKSSKLSSNHHHQGAAATQ